MSTSLRNIADFVEQIDIRQVIPSKNPLREHLGDLNDLQESILNVGLLQPIVVRPLGDRFEVVAGNRRLAACKAAKFRRIPAMIKDLSEREAFEASLAENVSRSTISPLEEARAFQKYVDEFGWGGASTLAGKIGKSPAYVSQRMKLLDLPQSIKDQLAESLITPSMAREITSLKDEGRQQALIETVLHEKMSVSKTRALIRQGREEDDITENYFAGDDLRKKMILLRNGIMALRLALIRLDGVIDKAEDCNNLRDVLMDSRYGIHQLIDKLLREQKNLKNLSQ